MIGLVAVLALGAALAVAGALRGDVFMATAGGVDVGVSIGFAIVRTVAARRRKSDGLLSAKDWLTPPPKDFKGQWCVDCGSSFVKWTNQNGFDPLTGDPKYVTFYACPGWDEKKADAAYQKSLTLALSMPMPMFDHPQHNLNCGERVKTPAVAFAHNDHESGEVVPTCPGCINAMIKEGIVTREAGREMLRTLAS